MPSPCYRLALTVEEASNAVFDAKERGEDVIRAQRCERCGSMHLHRKDVEYFLTEALERWGDALDALAAYDSAVTRDA